MGGTPNPRRCRDRALISHSAGCFNPRRGRIPGAAIYAAPTASTPHGFNPRRGRIPGAAATKKIQQAAQLQFQPSPGTNPLRCFPRWDMLVPYDTPVSTLAGDESPALHLGRSRARGDRVHVSTLAGDESPALPHTHSQMPVPSGCFNPRRGRIPGAAQEQLEAFAAATLFQPSPGTNPRRCI